MFGAFGDLVLAELRCILAPPRITVLGIVDDLAADFSVLDDLVDDVGASRALGHAPDAIAFEPVLEFLEQVEVGAFPQLVGRLLLKLAYGLVQLVLELLVFIEVLCVRAFSAAALALSKAPRCS